MDIRPQTPTPKHLWIACEDAPQALFTFHWFGSLPITSAWRHGAFQVARIARILDTHMCALHVFEVADMDVARAIMAALEREPALTFSVSRAAFVAPCRIPASQRLCDRLGIAPLHLRALDLPMFQPPWAVAPDDLPAEAAAS